MAIIGIDLGTSNSAAAVLRGGRPVIIPSAEGISLGGKAFPSYVAVTADGQTLIGESARRQATANPQGTATGFKRKMGQREKIGLHGKQAHPRATCETACFLQRSWACATSGSHSAAASPALTQNWRMMEGRWSGSRLLRANR